MSPCPFCEPWATFPIVCSRSDRYCRWRGPAARRCFGGRSTKGSHRAPCSQGNERLVIYGSPSRCECQTHGQKRGPVPGHGHTAPPLSAFRSISADRLLNIPARQRPARFRPCSGQAFDKPLDARTRAFPIVGAPWKTERKPACSIPLDRPPQSARASSSRRPPPPPMTVWTDGCLAMI